MLAFLCSTLLSYSVSAQRSAAKCAGFTAKVTNGSVLNLCNGSTITLSAEPADRSYTFQWQVQTTAGGPFASIAGATGSTYVVSSLGAYRVYISTGSCIDTSGITSVIRITPEGGKITPASANTICPGEVGGLIQGTQVPGADVGIVIYSWEKNEAGSGWAAISDIADQDLNVGHLFKTTDFRRVSSDNCGNKAYSNVVTLTIAPELIAGTISPMSQTINGGTTPAPISSVNASSGGSGNIGYQWQSSLYENTAFTDIAGATSASYSPGVLSQTTYYKRIAKDLRCFTTAASAVAVVIVRNAPLIPGTFTINSNCFFPGYPLTTPIKLTTNNEPTGGVPPYNVEWQSSTDNVNFTTIPGATGSVYQIGPLTESTYFRKKVTDAAGTVAYSSSEKITKIETPLTGGTIKPKSNVACLGSSPAEITSTGSPTGFVGLSYQWQYMNSSTGGAWKDVTGQIRASYFPEPITEKTTFRRLAVDQCGENKRTEPSNEVVIDIRPALIAGDIEPTSQTVRPLATPVALRSVAGPSGGTGSYSLSWERADLAVGPWDTIPSEHTVGYQPPALTNKSAYYRRVVMDNNCLATKYTYVVEVYLNKAAPINPCHLGGSQCVFPGNRPGVIDGGNMDVTGGVPPYTYTWETKGITAGTWMVISGATGESYQPQIITQSTQYRRKVTDAVGDFAYSDAFTIEYHTAALNGGTIALKSSVVCAGSTPGMIESVTGVSGYGENPKYQWQMMKEGGSWTDISGANEETYQPVNLTGRTHFRRAATDMCGGVSRICYSNEVIYDIPVSMMLHAGLVNGPFITCSGTAPGTIRSVLEACGGSSNLHYQWEVMQGGVWQTIAGATSATYTPDAITANTTYRRKVSDDCGSTGYSNAVEIFVYPPIEPGVIGTATQTVCMGQAPEKIRLMTGCHYTNGTVTYQWQSSATAGGSWSDVSGATASSYQPAAASSNMYYRLMVRSTTCAAVAYTNVVSVSVNTACRAAGGRADQTSDIKVYPNPLTGNAIKIAGDIKGKVNVRLLNAEGRAIPVTVSSAGTGLMNVTLPGVHSKGMYLMTVTDEKGSWTKKVIVQ